MTKYLLDANVFIQGKNLHYGFDFCPAFWDWIDEAHAAGIVHSIEGVRTEILAGSDELATWAHERPDSFSSRRHRQRSQAFRPRALGQRALDTNLALCLSSFKPRTITLWHRRTNWSARWLLMK
jgi:hypothetical protein